MYSSSRRNETLPVRHARLTVGSLQMQKRRVHFFQEKRRRAAAAPQLDIDAVAADPEVAGDIQSQLIELLLKLPPAGFERLSQRLLREAGFVQVVVTGRSGDGGIDGYGT